MAGKRPEHAEVPHWAQIVHGTKRLELDLQELARARAEAKKPGKAKRRKPGRLAASGGSA
jgi:hypothetical protein